MIQIVKDGTTELRAHGSGPIPEGWSLFSGELVYDPDDADGLSLYMEWDAGLGTIREMTDAEKLARAKKWKRQALKSEAVSQAALIYDFISSPDYYLFAEDLYLATVAAARAPLSGRLLQFKGVKDTFDAKRAEINALTDIALVRAYDVTTGW